jgi:hypothetical protein
VKVKLEAINRSAIPMQLHSIKNAISEEVVVKEIELKTNSNQSIDFEINLPSNINYTQPYWLAEQGTMGMYRVDQQVNIGKPDIIREVKLVFNVIIQGVSIPFEREVIYKYNDDVKGEVYKPLDIIPDVTTSIQSKVVLFNDNSSQTIDVKVKAGKDNVQGLVQLEIPENWKVTPKSISFNLSKKGEEQTVSFQIIPSKKASEVIAKCIATVDSKRFDKEQFPINYEHICKQQVLKTSEAKLIKLDIKTNKEKIVYIYNIRFKLFISMTLTHN